MISLLFGLLISEPQYATVRFSQFNCSTGICENTGSRHSFITKDIYFQKFQVLGPDNCSDCGVYTISLIEGRFLILRVVINQSNVTSTQHYTSDWLDRRKYYIEITSREKVQFFKNPILYWSYYPSPSPSFTPTPIPTYTFSSSNKFSSSDQFSSSNKFSSSNLFSSSVHFTASNHFSASKELIPARTSLQNFHQEKKESKKGKNKELVITLSTVLPVLAIIVVVIILFIIFKKHERIEQKTQTLSDDVVVVQKENEIIVVDQENPLYVAEVDPFLRMIEEEIIIH